MSKARLSILVFQHDSYEDPGHFLDFFSQDEMSWHTVEFHKDDGIPQLSSYDVLWVMGGPMNVWEEAEYPWLKREKETIRRWVEDGLPYLGICLGHQLLADAMGGLVEPAPQPVFGIQEIRLTASGRSHPLFAGIEWRKGLQWHGAQVMCEPPGATVLASSSNCRINAMCVTERAFGIQYHPELTDRTVRDWAQLPPYRSVVPAAVLCEIEQSVQATLPNFRAEARRLYDSFIAICRRATV